MLPLKPVPSVGQGAPSARTAWQRRLVPAAAAAAVPCSCRQLSRLPCRPRHKHAHIQASTTAVQQSLPHARQDGSSSSSSSGQSSGEAQPNQQQERQQHLQDEERRQSNRQCSTSYSTDSSSVVCRSLQPQTRRCSSRSSSRCTQPQAAAAAAAAAADSLLVGQAAATAVAAGAAAAAAAPGWGYIGPIGLGSGLGAPRCWQLPSSSWRSVRDLQQQSRGRLVIAGAAAAAVTGGTWQPAVGASMRGVLLGVVLTIGAQLLLVLLLRTLWAKRALASLDSWLQRTFGVSLRIGSSSNSSNGADRGSSFGSSAFDRLGGEDDLWELIGRPVGGNGRPLSRAGSNVSSSSAHSNGSSAASGASDRAAMTALVQNAPGESVEWVNMCFRKIWRVYQRGLERWITDLLQPVFDGLISPGTSPAWLLRLRIVELTLDHEAPYFSNMRRRNSRKDSDLTGVVDLRYTGGARLLLMLELGQGRWRFKIPVLVSDLDVQCALWLKLRLAPMCPWIGTISLAFVGPPAVKVQLSPYNRVRLMRIPVLQNLLNRLLTVDLPGLMVLPQRLEISIPPSVTSIAEAAVGRDTIMRAVASAVLQVDSLEQALLAALPLGPQAAAGGVSLPELFRGELTVLLREGRDLAVWGLPWQSNPWVRLVLGQQVVASRRDSETSTASRHGAPVWNQEVQFLVEDPEKQVLEVYVNDSHLTGRPKVGKATLPLSSLPRDGKMTISLPLEPVNPGQKPQGEVLLDISFKVFEDDEQDSGYREAQEYARAMQQEDAITDIRSAAAASSRAAVAASAAISAIAMTKAAAARAAARTAQAAKEAGAAALSSVTQQPQQQQQQQKLLPPPGDGEEAVSPGSQQQKQQQKGKGRDDQDGTGGGSSGGGGYGSNAEERQSNAAKAVADAVARQRREREEALAEALEARMAVRVRSANRSRSSSNGNGATNGKAPQQQQQGDAASKQAAEQAAAATVAKAAPSTDAASPGKGGSTAGGADMTVTLPADILSDSSSEEDEAAAVARAQQAVVDILEKSRRMEAAVAELAALTAGSPAEAVLQQETMKAAAATADALKSLQNLDTTATASASLASTDLVSTVSSSSGGGGGGVGGISGIRVHHAGTPAGSRDGSSGSGGLGPRGWGAGSRNVAGKSPSPLNSMSEGGAVAAAAAVDSALTEYEHQAVRSNGSSGSSVDLNGSNGAAAASSSSSSAAGGDTSGSSGGQHKYGDFASEYSIWDEESATVPSGTSAADAAASAAGAAATTGSSSNVTAADAGEAVAAALGAVAAAEQQVQLKGTKAAGAKGAGVKQQKQKQKKAAASAAPEPKPWWAVLIPYIPSSSSKDSSSKDGKSPAAESTDDSSSSVEPQHPEPPAMLVVAEPLSESQRHWWEPLLDNDFMRSLPGVSKKGKGGKEQQQAAGEDSTAAAAAEGAEAGEGDGADGEAAGEKKQKQKPWWSAVTDLSWVPGLGGSSVDDAGREDAAAGAAADGASKPVEAIVIPADLPIEEIAREVAKLKEDAWRSKEDHLENLWARTVERNDRSWLMLLCFLLSVAIGLLAVVAYRISGLGDSGADPADAAATAAAAAAAAAAAGGVSPDAAVAAADSAQQVSSAAGDAVAAVAAVAAAAAAAAPDAATAAGAAAGSDGGEGVTNLVTQVPIMTLAVLSWWLGTWGGGGGGDF